MSTPISRPRPILTAAQMRAAEDRVIAGGVSVEALMARAGAAVAEAVWRHAGAAPTLVLCGPGNNGGDGYVIARLLAERGVDVAVAASGDPRTLAAQAARRDWDGAVVPLAAAQARPVLIDALFGTGLARPLDDAVAAPLRALAGPARVRVGVDLPSGIETDTGRLLADLPRFDLTVALGALKPAHLIETSAPLMGRPVVADIGLDEIASDLHAIARPALRTPGPQDHKYSRGKVVVLAGAMGGAAALAAGAAQAAGAGYVELVGGAGQGVPLALVRRDWDAALLDDARIGAVVVGPGLGHDAGARDRLDAALASGHKLVIDADALALIGKGGMRRFVGEHVLTPHWGEFTRLFGDDGDDRLTQARRAAATAGAVVILKGAASIVAHPDGRAAIASLAPAWLASAGTGDVLAGLVGAMLAGGRDPFDAAQAAVWLHAEAARRAGPFLIADDLVAHLPAAAAACL